MKETLFITAGGSGHRLDAADGIPKALMELPSGQTVIERQLDQIGDDFDIVVCAGLRSDLMAKLLPSIKMVTTYDVENPVGILGCMKQILWGTDSDSYTFLLGDTVWHPLALAEALEHRHDGAISVYGNRTHVPCETFMITVSGEGLELLREVLEQPGPLDVDNGKWFQLEQMLRKCVDFKWHHYIKRMKANFAVDDFDVDYQYNLVWENYRRGIYS